MRKFILNLSLIAFALSFAGCNADEEMMTPDEGTQHSDRTFTAYLEGNNDTKTYLKGEKLKWNADETIGIFEDYQLAASIYQITPESVGTGCGTFTKVQGADQTAADKDLSGWNVAVFPYMENIICEQNPASRSSFTLDHINIPNNQEYYPVDELGNTYPMIAISRDDTLQFRNIASLIKVNVRGSERIAAITLNGNRNEQICGNFFVDMNIHEYVPHLRATDVADQSNSVYSRVILDCGTGVELSTTEDKTFTLTINPTEFAEGFTVSIVAESGETMKISTNKPQIAERSHALVMPTVNFEPTGKTIVFGTTSGTTSENNGLVFEYPTEVNQDFW